MVGSDLSLTGQDTDLEMDYYDYNVQNTSAVPGSYLGMDPAYCVWIPPFAPPEQWATNDGSEEDSVCSSSTNDIEMKVIARRRPKMATASENDSSRSETPSEKFQRECREKEKFKRFSNVSTASSGNKTIVPEDEDIDLTPDNDLAIRDVLRPDPPIRIRKAEIVKEHKALLLLEKEDLKFADEDEDEEVVEEEEDSDTAYNSEDNCSEVSKKVKKARHNEAVQKDKAVKYG